MEKIKQRWEIQQNWQLLFPILGIILVLITAYTIARRFLHVFDLNNTYFEWPFTIGITAILYYIMVKFFLWCFKKLEHKWKVSYKWEMIAIFIVFAITGSVSGKLAGPVTEWIGIQKDVTSAWIYWPIRILLIFPLYQVLLVAFGWIFGQFRFFWGFEKKMLKRMGLGFLIP
ncbi:prolipoprotein diacylglyceryl transferase [Muricauda sp. AC10]|nr:prolipoprotein diacylglyceryl transferase [Muricauda sp. AC10]